MEPAQAQINEPSISKIIANGVHRLESAVAKPEVDVTETNWNDAKRSNEVVATGKGTKDEEMILKEGDTVLYGKYAGTELEFDGTKYMMMRQSDVLAVVEE